MTASQAWTTVKEELLEIENKYVPNRPGRNNKKQPWMTQKILREMRRKQRLWKKERNSAEYKEQTKRVKKLVRNAKRGFERRLARGEGNKRPFYSYVKKKTKITLEWAHSEQLTINWLATTKKWLSY